jgi:polyhydroxyalkanoate synthesis repressor PhaR
LLHCSIKLTIGFIGAFVNDLGYDCALQQGDFPVQARVVVIKKYGNRRLYDTSGSRYINLEDIATLIRNGTDVKVVNAKTDEDLTRLTLTQIIVEDAKAQPQGLPVEFLRQLIMATDRVGREFIMWYLKTAFDAYQKVQHAVQSRFAGVHSAALSPLQAMKNLLQTPQSEDGAARDEELEELRRRVAFLEGRLKKNGPPKVGRKRSSKRPPRKQ